MCSAVPTLSATSAPELNETTGMSAASASSIAGERASGSTSVVAITEAPSATHSRIAAAWSAALLCALTYEIDAELRRGGGADFGRETPEQV